MHNDQLFFVGQKAFIEKGGEILTLTDPKLGLDFPGGKIKKENYKEVLDGTGHSKALEKYFSLS